MSEFSRLFRAQCEQTDPERDKELTAPADVVQYIDIPYTSEGERDPFNRLDIYTPQAASGRLPVIVSVHGGAYVYGTKEVYRFYGMNLAQQGFAFVNMNYHLAPESKFPNQLKEVNQVMEWILAHGAEYGLDTENIFMAGDSAGAQIASHYCAVWSSPEFAGLFPFRIPEKLTIRAVALNCGFYDISASAEAYFAAQKEIGGLDRTVLLDDYIGLDRKEKNEMLKVMEHLTPHYPPAYLMTSYYDFLRESAEPMYERLLQNGAEAEYHLYGSKEQEYMGHVFHCNMNLMEAAECNQDECRFFRKFFRG